MAFAARHSQKGCRAEDPCADATAWLEGSDRPRWETRRVHRYVGRARRSAPDVALLYSSATDNKIYQALQAKVDLIMFNGSPYQLASFTQGITTPIRAADDFPATLVEWNRETSPGKFAPDEEFDATTDEEEGGDNLRVLLSETPIEAVWLRLGQFHSVRLAQGMIEGRAARAGAPLSSEVLKHKSEGAWLTWS